MSLYRLIFLSLTVIALSACAGQKLTITQPAEASVKQANSYSWSSTPLSSEGQINNHASVFDAALRKNIQNSMDKKGYSYREKGGDLTLDYRITVFSQAAASIVAQDAQAIWRKNTYGDMVFDGWTQIDGADALNNTAVLLLTAYQGTGRQKVWEAYVKRIVKNEGSLNSSLIENAVDTAVKRLMGTFPAR